VSLGVAQKEQYTGGFFGTPGPYMAGAGQGGDLFEHLYDFEEDELRVLAGVFQQRAQEARRQGQEAVAEHLQQTGAFVRRVARVPRLNVEERFAGYYPQRMFEDLQRSLWLMQHDLTAGVYIHMADFAWDTHLDNDARQQEMNEAFAAQLVWLLQKLDETENHRGSLADQTAVVISSELGRFPRLNKGAGKDHFPQTPVVLVGPWFKGGKTFGATGRQTEALPIDFMDGRPNEAGRRVVLDDLGATLLHLVGMRPEPFGYEGTVMEFLLA
jgi:hypothetical protein